MYSYWYLDIAEVGILKRATCGEIQSLKSGKDVKPDIFMRTDILCKGSPCKKGFLAVAGISSQVAIRHTVIVSRDPEHSADMGRTDSMLHAMHAVLELAVQRKCRDKSLRLPRRREPRELSQYGRTQSS